MSNINIIELAEQAPDINITVRAGDLIAAARELVAMSRAGYEGKDREREEETAPTAEPKRYVYGLRGIRNLFGVSHATAQRYKDTFLATAVSQRGRNIMVDVDMAIRLFNERKESE